MFIKLQNLHYQIAHKSIVNQVSVEIEKGQIIGLIGPNGAGKTSLLKILANIVPASSGSYYLDGKPIQHYSEKALAQRFAYLAQNATAHWPLRVQRLIELGRLPWQGYRQQLNKQDHEKVQQAIQITQVEHLLDRVVTTLSGGEQTRVFLARLFAQQPELIFADEPIAALDPYHQLHIMEILQQHAKSGGTVIVVMHDINLACRFCDKIMLMDKGKIKRFCTVNTLFNDNLLADTYKIELRTYQENDGFAVIPWQRYKTDNRGSD